MFEFVYKHKKAIQIIFMVLIVPPFALFGIDVYFREAGGGQAVARVGDYNISTEEFSQALRERQNVLHRTMPGRIDPEMLDNPPLRQAILDSLINRRLLLLRAQSAGVTVTDAQLKAAINGQEVFKDGNGQFSYERYVEFLRGEGMTPAVFEARMRQDIIIRQIGDGLAETGFLPRAESELLQRIVNQQREISYATLSPEAYLAKVKIEPEAVKKYYDANPAEFRIPEQVRAEYLVLSMETLAKGIEVNPEEVKKYYEANRRQFGVEESRRAAHILIAPEAGGGPEAKQKAKARAEELHRELLKNPKSFAAVAKRHSQDPGSAAKGGDLGRVSPGSMKDTPALERAIFQLKSGEISAPVETQHGYHIVQVTDVEPATVKSFDQVRAQIEQELRKQQAARRFAELAEKFNNTVYEQSESLKPAAELAQSQTRVSGWVTRESAEPPLNHPRLLAALFSDEALRERRNTEAIEVAPGTLVAARVAEHKPAAVQPFEEARAALEKRLALREAARLAAEEARGLLEALKQGKPAKVEWGDPQLVSRDDTKNIPEPVLRQAFRMDASKLPAYGSVDSPRGATILLRLDGVRTPDKIPPEKAQQVTEQMQQILAQEVFSAYLASLRQKIGVKVFKEQLEKKQ
jgi:peptidyl-prolyl cis-trans isomerase D